ncbi:unnamed protein product [Vitrella brassicaformis CCMP3155]|uniref:Uncharacterized protein n=1 Tax=Vitrella brassicaformis (strain CCMP3155) TaxID=1169540 RepID=A0A0G4FSL9_VITBC|nr:unnamed protein product [Vitrella brassicaformis CCMP3155]|eukprot:CEM17701.1 unnamed protein product [Vitrella brassicaformis CCMP3155]
MAFFLAGRRQTQGLPRTNLFQVPQRTELLRWNSHADLAQTHPSPATKDGRPSVRRGPGNGVSTQTALLMAGMNKQHRQRLTKKRTFLLSDGRKSAEDLEAVLRDHHQREVRGRTVRDKKKRAGDQGLGKRTDKGEVRRVGHKRRLDDCYRKRDEHLQLFDETRVCLREWRDEIRYERAAAHRFMRELHVWQGRAFEWIIDDRQLSQALESPRGEPLVSPYFVLRKAPRLPLRLVFFPNGDVESGTNKCALYVEYTPRQCLLPQSIHCDGIYLPLEDALIYHSISCRTTHKTTDESGSPACAGPAAAAGGVCDGGWPLVGPLDLWVCVGDVVRGPEAGYLAIRCQVE